MDGFVYAQDVLGLNGTEAMGYYTRSDIPYYYDYADNYVLDDNFFSSLLGPSLPNHLCIASGTSGGIIDNNGGTINSTSLGIGALHLTWLTLAQELNVADVSWAWYTGDKNPTSRTIWNVLPLYAYFQQNPQPPLIEPTDFVAGEPTSPRSNGYYGSIFAFLQNFMLGRIITATAILAAVVSAVLIVKRPVRAVDQRVRFNPPAGAEVVLLLAIDLLYR